MQKLIDYSVISIKNSSTKIRMEELIKEHKLKEEVDFNTSDIRCVRKNRGIIKKTIYMLTPKAFRVDVHPIG